MENFKYASCLTSFDEMNEYVKNEEQKVRSTLTEVRGYFKQRLKNKLNFGLTHGDHREGNVITNGKILNIIDFDLPCHNWLSEDLFRPFFDSIVNDNLSYKNIIIPSLDGYFEVMPQNSVELDSFSKHIQMKCLEIYLWTKNNWSNDSDAPGGKEKVQWISKIHSKIINNDWQKQLPIL